MGSLKDKLLSLVETSTAQTRSLIDSMNETIDSIDWDAQVSTLNTMKDAFLKRSKELLGEVNDLLKEVKNNLTDFEVTVPFDESLGEKFEYSIEDNKLTVKVSFEDDNMVRCNSTTVNIPQNCDVEKLSKRYNNLAKTMTVIIPKTIVEPSAEAKKEEEKPTTGFKLNKTATTPKTTKKEETPEEHQASSKLLKKFKENTVRRAANGRFVKRTAPTE